MNEFSFLFHYHLFLSSCRQKETETLITENLAVIALFLILFYAREI